MQSFKFGVFQQDGIDFLVKPCSFFLLDRYLSPGEMLLDKCFPVGELLVTPIQAQVDRKAHGATYVMAGGRVMCQRIGAFTMVVMAATVLKQVTENIGVCRHQGRRSNDRKLHQTFPLSCSSGFLAHEYITLSQKWQNTTVELLLIIP
ncbi:MAG: hypothetical protein DDT24_00091 [Chloroflexi bacterium]|nr:hypothetical protein [Chloroflexota bacterium]